MSMIASIESSIHIELKDINPDTDNIIPWTWMKTYRINAKC